MRQWITDRVNGSPGHSVVTVSDLEQFLATRSHTTAG